MTDHKLRDFLGIVDCNGHLDCPIAFNGRRMKGMLAHLRDRIESLEAYLGIEFVSSPSAAGYPKHIKAKTK